MLDKIASTCIKKDINTWRHKSKRLLWTIDVCPIVPLSPPSLSVSVSAPLSLSLSLSLSVSRCSPPFRAARGRATCVDRGLVSARMMLGRVRGLSPQLLATMMDPPPFTPLHDGPTSGFWGKGGGGMCTGWGRAWGGGVVGGSLGKFNLTPVFHASTFAADSQSCPSWFDPLVSF